jgi:hypothetical protein
VLARIACKSSCVAARARRVAISRRRACVQPGLPPRALNLRADAQGGVGAGGAALDARGGGDAAVALAGLRHVQPPRPRPSPRRLQKVGTPPPPSSQSPGLPPSPASVFRHGPPEPPLTQNSRTPSPSPASLLFLHRAVVCILSARAFALSRPLTASERATATPLHPVPSPTLAHRLPHSHQIRDRGGAGQVGPVRGAEPVPGVAAGGRRLAPHRCRRRGPPPVRPPPPPPRPAPPLSSPPSPFGHSAAADAQALTRCAVCGPQAVPAADAALAAGGVAGVGVPSARAGVPPPHPVQPHRRGLPGSVSRPVIEREERRLMEGGRRRRECGSE